MTPTRMMHRDDLDQWLRRFYQTDDFKDYCHNGLQVEGRREIRRVVLGVSLNGLLLKAAVNYMADAVIVHHGFFGRDLFRLTGIRQRWVATLLKHEISLFGIHLPMDAHPVLGHNALITGWMGGNSPEPLGPGFLSDNATAAPLDELLRRLAKHLPGREGESRAVPGHDEQGFRLEWRHGFQVLANGPEMPRRLAVVSGGSADLYESAVSRGVDAFFCGEIKEPIPALSRETRTHFINLGHYRSELPGIRALRDELASRLNLHARFVDVPNPI
ncbi:MAG TPA: Nif3-like dinuclear metal center hexameric protein [Candidatus Aminicenantes bacterium]|nr:Nif3-like dinuclear metal center hexameric protein [Candidatus Aminicenantes bacterium]